MSPPQQAPFTNRWLPARKTDGGVLKPLYLRNASVSWLKAHSNYHFKLHRHTSYELVIPLRGAYHCTLNGKALVIQPGCLLFVQELDFHEDFYGKGIDFAAFSFSLHDFTGARWSHGVFATDSPITNRNIRLSGHRCLAALASMTLEEAKSRHHPSIAVETLIEAFFWLLTEQLPEKHLSTSFRHNLGENAFRRRLFECFAQNLRERPRMSVIAAHLGMSERSLDTQCRAVTGTSPAAAFNSYSMHEAARLLAMGMRVHEVADQLGFTDQFYFSKVFKRCLGFSPPARLVKRHLPLAQREMKINLRRLYSAENDIPLRVVPCSIQF